MNVFRGVNLSEDPNQKPNNLDESKPLMASSHLQQVHFSTVPSDPLSGYAAWKEVEVLYSYHKDYSFLDMGLAHFGDRLE